MRRALVIGTGAVGRNVIHALEAAGGWEIVALARRAPNFPTTATFQSVDLNDAAAARRALAAETGVTHVFYGALAGGVDATTVADNMRLLVNALSPLIEHARGLERIVLVQGAKYYGNHIGPHMTPTPEDAPRHLPPNFYYDQEDWLLAARRGRDFALTMVRPALVIGLAEGTGLNMLNAFALLGAICRELDAPLDFPGNDTAFRALNNFTDARLMGRFMAWAATAAAAEDAAFNITNAVAFRWEYLWPEMTRLLGCRAGRVRPMSLARMMADKEPLWRRIVERYGLVPHPMAALTDWTFADYTFGRTWDSFLSDRKRIRAGFAEVLDPVAMFSGLFAELRERRIVPPTED